MVQLHPIFRVWTLFHRTILATIPPIRCSFVTNICLIHSKDLLFHQFLVMSNWNLSSCKASCQKHHSSNQTSYQCHNLQYRWATTCTQHQECRNGNTRHIIIISTRQLKAFINITNCNADDWSSDFINLRSELMACFSSWSRKIERASVSPTWQLLKLSNMPSKTSMLSSFAHSISSCLYQLDFSNLKQDWRSWSRLPNIAHAMSVDYAPCSCRVQIEANLKEWIKHPW